MDSVLKVFSALMPLLSLALAWLVGSRVAVRWGVRQKRRESVHSAVGTFQLLYGRWFALSKLWILHLNVASEEQSVEMRRVLADREWDLFRRVVELEGEFEAFWLKLAAQYVMPVEALEQMERFREGFQVLRRHVVERKVMRWFASDSVEYREFKRLAAQLVTALSNEQLVADRAQGASFAVKAFSSVTSNRFQQDWFAPPGHGDG